MTFPLIPIKFLPHFLSDLTLLLSLRSITGDYLSPQNELKVLNESYETIRDPEASINLHNIKLKDHLQGKLLPKHPLVSDIIIMSAGLMCNILVSYDLWVCL